METTCRQLIFAREYRGYSQAKLASQIPGLTQSQLSKFEKGIGTLSKEKFDKIVALLKFPPEFYDKNMKVSADNAHYRKRVSMSKGDKLKIESSYTLIGEIVDQMAESIEFPDFTLQSYDLETGLYSPESIAQYVRNFFGLGEGPVRDINTILEKHGIIIVEIEVDVDEFDGVSFLTRKGHPVIILNKGFSNDRKRRNLAHELGHILMHTSHYMYATYRDGKELEKEADRFASEFLMPESSIINSLRKLKLSDLAGLKQYWLTSMSSIVRRAKDLECINESKYKYFYIELSRYRKVEPIEVYIDEPKAFAMAYTMHKQELGYSDLDMAKAFGLSIDIIQKFCTTSKIRKLRLVYKDGDSAISS